jgi:hypothetical protein
VKRLQRPSKYVPQRHSLESMGHRMQQHYPETTASRRERNMTASYATRLFRLKLLAPDILGAILNGEQPPDLAARGIMADTRLSPDWNEQRRRLGFASTYAPGKAAHGPERRALASSQIYQGGLSLSRLPPSPGFCNLSGRLPYHHKTRNETQRNGLASRASTFVPVQRRSTEGSKEAPALSAKNATPEPKKGSEKRTLIRGGGGSLGRTGLARNREFFAFFSAKQAWDGLMSAVPSRFGH